MSEPQTNQPDSSGMTFDAQPVTKDTTAHAPADSGMTFDSEPTQASMTINPDGKPKFAPYDAANFGRYTTPENYEKWASTQPKTGPDLKPGEYESWTGAHLSKAEALATIPKAAGETLAGVTLAGPLAAGIAAVPSVGVALLKHLAEQSPELFGHAAVAETLKRYAIEGVKKTLTGAAWAGGAETLHAIWDDVFGKKK